MGDPLADDIFGASYSTPTLHVLGKTDVVVVEERSNLLLGVSANARLEEHAGGWYNSLPFDCSHASAGHFVPSKVNWRDFFRDYLRNPLGDVLSPSSGAVL